MEIVVGNSFCKIIGASSEANELVTELLTYHNDIEAEKGQLFYKLKIADGQGNRKMRHMILAKIRYLDSIEWVCMYKNDSFPTGLLNIVKDSLEASNFELEIVDERILPSNSIILRWNNEPFGPRYYQKELIERGLEMGRGVFEAAVGSGKSLIMANIIKEQSVCTLIVVPSRGLSDQIFNDFVVWFGHDKVELIDAQKVRKTKKLKPIRIITIQSLGSLQKSGDLDRLIGDIDAIHCDEIHHAGAQTYTNLLKDLDHVYHRYGYTGTFLRNDNKTLEMWGFLSNVIGSYPAHQAIKDGYLTPVEVVVHQLEGKSSKSYPKEYDNCYCANPAMLERIHQVCLKTQDSEQVLILVNKKDKSGSIIHEYLKTVGVPNFYISGDDEREDISDCITFFNEKKIKILIGTSVLGEGIDIRSTDHLILANGGKSEIVIVQAIGRAVRIYPDKHVAYVHDFLFPNTKYMQKHFYQRMDIIESNFSPKKVYFDG